jgi:putative heme-binding domain-containing protein
MHWECVRHNQRYSAFLQVQFSMCRVARRPLILIGSSFHWLPTIFLFLVVANARGETLRQAESLEQLLRGANTAELVKETQLRGDPKRGALIFYRSSAACINCHASGEGKSPLGPNIASLKEGIDPEKLTDAYLIESLIFPSKALRKGYETAIILTDEDSTITGLVVEESDSHMTLRSPNDLEHPLRIDKASIENRTLSKQSMMPDGLMSALKDQSQFYDLASYVIQVARGGVQRASELKPSVEQLAIKEDWNNLDHAGILKKLKQKDFEAGQAIYHGYCVECHGPDGNRPTLATARAFGTQKLKFGADPYKMFMTLTRGNGLMGPTSHLSPLERYQVVHYIREHFMKPTNPEYSVIDSRYLASLPKGTEDGTFVPTVERDLGPAIASQLDNRFRSVLTINLGSATISYDTHTMNQAGLWTGGILDLNQTHHARNRGEGTASPKGKSIPRLQGWKWGHDGNIDYSRKDILPRGPLPNSWMDYQGYYLQEDSVQLSYSVDEREVLETVKMDQDAFTIRHRLKLGPGRKLVLSVLDGKSISNSLAGFVAPGQVNLQGNKGDASRFLATAFTSKNGAIGDYCVAAVYGNVQGMEWSIDSNKRIVLMLPSDDQARVFDVVCSSGTSAAKLKSFGEQFLLEQTSASPPSLDKPSNTVKVRWPEVMKTVGVLGLQQGAYALDTLTIPTSTPWNTWFRTSALDFFPDGRMVVTTYGGDVWIVSGIDDSLLRLRWKRFASGLYEPMGVKVVDGKIYATCKDRIVRLHDRDKNGEADFYESFSPDADLSFHFHSFNFDLQTDSQGNFYYAKGGHDADFALPGAVIQISPDGKKRAYVATGFRVPNGMGWMPGDRLTCSDNQGQWMPASKISLLRRGGFYGWVPTYDGKGKWAPDGGKIDVTKVIPPKTFDQPIIWMPQEFDNSSGGQLWADDPRWGPLSGRLLHTSFGKGWLSYLMTQEIDGTMQAAIIKLPFDFRTGIMRAKINPKDGQVYATGLQGWNGSGRFGLLDQGVQRLRYTGKPINMITNCQVTAEGLQIDFSFPVDTTSATEVASYTVKQWNYQWRKDYGSEMYSPKTGKVGIEPLDIKSISLSEDRQSVTLHASDLKPVNQLHLIVKVKSHDGNPFEEEVYWTIHRVPNR